MKNTLYILGLLVAFFIGCLTSQCTHTETLPAVSEEKKEAIKENIKSKESEVEEKKDQKAKIVYRTLFDTLATRDTIYIELIKCDSVVKIDSAIIADQDTIISGKDSLIAICETEKTILKSDLKKQKRKNFITKVIGVVAIVVTIVVSR